MAKKRVRRYRRAKGRWSANIKKLTTQSISAEGSSEFYASTDLCQNPVQNDSSVSQQYTVKNVELSFEFELNSNQTNYTGIEGIVCYIMYVPQGMNVDNNYPNYHPEYIMAMRFLGSPNLETGSSATPQQPGRNPLRIKTRLARRLQTGDKIILYINGTNTTTSSTLLSFNGLIRWWTKAN